MRDALVTIIVTNFNYRSFVESAIRSVTQQTYRRIECIVVDDGSTDGSVDLLRSVSGITLVEKANGGQVSAVIAGMARATGSIVVFLDADDMLNEDACETIVREMDDDCSLFQFALDKIDNDGRVIGRYPHEPFLTGGWLERVKRYGEMPSSPTSGNAFARSHVDRMLATIGDEKTYYIDGYLIFSAPFHGRIKFLDRALGRYRVHGANVSLAAGLSARTAENDVLNALWQRRCILRCQGIRADQSTDTLGLLSPYQLRNALLVRAGYSDRPALAFLGRGDLLARAIGKFVTFPDLSLRKRVKGIATCIAVALSPGALVRRVFSAV